MNQLRILLVEDETIVREGVKALINAKLDMQVVGEAADGVSAVQLAQHLQPDVIIMDVQMPRMNGAEATRQIRSVSPSSRIVALTMFDDKSYVRELFESGVSGYVVKRSAVQDLIRAVRVVAENGTFFDPIIQTQVLTRPLPNSDPSAPPTGAELSEREIQVLRMIAEGYSNKEIAERINISVKTVETYRTRAMEKLNLRNRVEIVRYAILCGWLTA